MKRAKTKGWAIAGEVGIYVGWWLKRADAIAAHVDLLNGLSGQLNGRLTGDQIAAWKKCQQRGDRAIRVKISEIS